MSKHASVFYFHPLTKLLGEEVIKHCCSKENGELQNAVVKGNISWDHFSDAWPNLFIEDVKVNCAGRNVIFLGSLHDPAIIFEQISILYALPRYLSHSVTFILPYFPTATMERIDTEGKIATAATMARILSAIPLSTRGPCQIIIFDIHALQERFYFGDHVIPRLESAMPLLLQKIDKEKIPNVTIVFPDDGAFKRFHTIFENLFPLIVCNKIREADQRVIKIKEGVAEDRHCIIVDDLVMTGETLIKCAEAVKKCGASTVSAFVTHAVFPNDSWKKFTGEESLFTNFYITDSIPYASTIAEQKPFQLLSLADLIAKILHRYDLNQ